MSPKRLEPLMAERLSNRTPSASILARRRFSAISDSASFAEPSAATFQTEALACTLSFLSSSMTATFGWSGT